MVLTLMVEVAVAVAGLVSLAAPVLARVVLLGPGVVTLCGAVKPTR